MKKICLILLLWFYVIPGNLLYAQQTIGETTILFSNQEPLFIKLRMSVKDVKKNTNDSTFLESILYYKNEVGLYDSLKIDLRARGNNRRDNCYYAPLKLKLSKSATKGTLFEGNKKLKLVLPCLIESHNNDYVIKELMAYQLYEIVTPVHYKTRLVNIEFIEEKGKRTITKDLKGVLIEDIDNVAKRLHGNEIKRRILPLQQDDLASIRNSFFQYLIANTDFSTTYLHNGKLLFVDKKIIPLPYDFDMSGLVDASYSVVSNIQNVTLDITDVKERVYKGYKRDALLFEQVRKEFINNKSKMFEVIDHLEKHFEDSNQFIIAKRFVTEFFDIIENDKSFKKKILDKARED
ncbi:hypothetical protein V8G56_06975 [Gaetbulibacter aquiaggeris]|uniref:Uncharacterized protein n=1 Tax=Gaetbulibacter aquiaggeris TaxID=1735373 RepID=A0ABW7MNS3_9FLAO